MPSCCVPLCTNGYASERKARKEAGRPNPSFFKIKPDQLEKWTRAIPRQDRALTIKDWVCSDHFHESDIERCFQDITVGDTIIKGEPRKKPLLKPDAVPSIFGGPAYLSKPEKCRRKTRPPVNQTKNAKQVNELTEKKDTRTQEEKLVKDKHKEDTNVQIKLPGPNWCIHTSANQVIYMKLNNDGTVTHTVQIQTESKELTVKVRGCTYPIEITVATTLQEVNRVLHQVDLLDICGGNGFGNFSLKCTGGIKRGIRCRYCRASKKNESKKRKREINAKKRKELNQSRSKRLNSLRKQNEKLKEKVASMKVQLKNSYAKCKNLEQSQIEKKIKSLPKAQQDAVNACLDAAKRKGPHGNRYEAEWVYECLLMRIKGPALYEHIRSNNILPLPSRATLNRYMRKLPPQYGFQPVLFNVLKQKLSSMPESDRHGNIILDEMKIPTGVSFDRHTLKFHGLVDMGEFTPEQDRGKMGDHILEVLFQPFRGKWVQSLGVFLTQSNCKGDILARIILEALALGENAGLLIDGVSTDAGTWNRVMWKKFGINETTSSCEHPMRENCRLYFFSDWSHLIKCARNILCPELPKKPIHEEGPPNKKRRKTQVGPNGIELSEMEVYKRKEEAALNKQIEIPEGIVRRKDWISLLDEETKLREKQGLAALTYVNKLTRTHVFPDGFERMNVKMAYQFFSNGVAAAMDFYRLKGVVSLENSQATALFIRKMNGLADALNSNGPAGAIREGNDKEETIKDFLHYHTECVNNARKKGLKAFFSEETDLGMSVTLKSTLDLSSYLINEVGFKYVMTAKFNSDAIEQFFGKLRNALRQNPHPDAKIFIQMHRLLSIYSLVKPPKGSNVDGGENLKNLLTAEDSLAETEKERLDEIGELLDEIVVNGEVYDPLPEAGALDHSYLASPVQCEENLLSFMAGFTAFRQKLVAKNCEDCLLTFTVFREETGADCTFSRIKEVYNGYSYPTPEMKAVISSCERAVRESLATKGISCDLFKTTLQFMKLDTCDLVGCINHKEDVTKRIVKFYLIMRMFFAADRKNEEVRNKKKQGKKLVKQAKLV